MTRTLRDQVFFHDFALWYTYDVMVRASRPR
jgi:hypothetical protein